VTAAMRDRFAGPLAEKNVAAAEAAYDLVQPRALELILDA
jgi:Pyruvate/2-oxoacid:ferredoxin oxidoreductase gamma subunit